MMLCFPSGRKKKKEKHQAANGLHHFNYVISILEMLLSQFPRQKSSAAYVWKLSLASDFFFEQFMPRSPGPAFSYSLRSHRRTSPAKSKESQLFRTGPGHVQHLAKLRGSTPLCSLFCICCRDPLRTIKSTSSRTSSLLLLHLHEREVTRNGHVWWEPRSMAAQSPVVNAALEDPGAGCRKDKSRFLISPCESGWLCGR